MSAYRLIALGLVGTLAVAACNAPETPTEPPTQVATAPGAPPKSSAPTLAYDCESGQTVRLQYPDPATAQLTYQGKASALRLVPSGSGARYAGSGMEWWIATRDGQENATLSRLGPNGDVGVAVMERCSRPSANPDLPVPGQTPPAEPTPCLAANLRLGTAGGDAGAGNRLGIVSVLNTGPAVCGLSGYPDLSLLDGKEKPITTLRIDPNPNTSTPVALAPNGRAYFDVAWTVVPDESAGQTVCPSVAQIAVRLAGDPKPLTLAMAFQPCGVRIRVNPYRAYADPAEAPAPVAASATT
ncbi:hypothetical protein BZG35_06380 [Brevundimonas sp. LM2]|uniref:DUF4232 domain-containing protein n=1 Tax=Brevundimonas sp. LM2 TaxID=1938605 RepID=UPI00098404B8|nr:DUF4232 domain-containing protein [Brevundimonas sp. LM2]AQR61318.1 hypothetical protein BZG35_06380 [Brevundimonas sp. LM2]